MKIFIDTQIKMLFITIDLAPIEGVSNITSQFINYVALMIVALTL